MKPDKIYLSLALLIILSAISWISSCTHKADLTGMYHPCVKEISMILNSSCVNFVTDTVTHTVLHCHDGQGEPFRRLDAIEYYYLSFPTDKNPYSNPVYKAITAKWGENKMPPSGPLSLDNRTIIRLWIEQGADTTIAQCDSK